MVIKEEPYRFCKASSDFSGKDIFLHNINTPEIIKVIRTWFYNVGKDALGTIKMAHDYNIWVAFNNFGAWLFKQHKYWYPKNLDKVCLLPN